jgi:hypothetical protein
VSHKWRRGSGRVGMIRGIQNERGMISGGRREARSSQGLFWLTELKVIATVSRGHGYLLVMLMSDWMHL